MSITVPTSPAWAPEQLLPSMRAFLRAAGVVRLPADTPTSGGPPPMWLDPKKGIPYPGQTEGIQANEGDPKLVMAAYPSTGIPSAAYEGFIVRMNATIWYRALNTPIAAAKHEQIRSLLHDKRNYSMNGLLVNESLFFREFQRINSDERGFVYNCELTFTLMMADTYTY